MKREQQSAYSELHSSVGAEMHRTLLRWPKAATKREKPE